MSWELVLRHCAALRATLDQTRVSLELQASQLAGLEAFATAQRDQQVPTARLQLHEQCTHVPEDKCALRDESAWQDRSSFAARMRTCRGCGYVEGT